jgi:hypothetical protein
MLELTMKEVNGGTARLRPGTPGRLGVRLVMPGGGEARCTGTPVRRPPRRSPGLLMQPPPRRSPGVTIRGRDARASCRAVVRASSFQPVGLAARGHPATHEAMSRHGVRVG